MAAHPSSLEDDAAEADLARIERELARLAELADRDAAPEVFYDNVLRTGIGASAALGGAVWLVDERGELIRRFFRVEDAGGELGSNASSRRRREVVAGVLRDRHAQLVPPGDWSSSVDVGSLAGHGDSSLILAPLFVAQEPLGVLEFIQRADAPPEAHEGVRRLAEQLAAIAETYQANHAQRNDPAKGDTLRSVTEFSTRIHASLDPAETAYAIANEGRRLAGCDRLSVVVLDRFRPRMLAVSGVDSFDRRSAAVQSLEKLCGAVAAVGQALWVTGGERDLPPELDQPLEAYLEETQARAVGVLPLVPDRAGRSDDRADDAEQQAIAALAVEQFTGEASAALRQRAEAIVAPLATVALANALEVKRLPLGHLSRTLKRSRRWFGPSLLPRTLLAIGAVVAILAALILVPADFTIEATGELQPAERRDVFAPADGVVDVLHARHGMDVTEETELLVMRDLELEFEMKRVEGERRTIRKRLDAIESARVENRRRSEEEQQRYKELTAEKSELEAALDGLARQQEILGRRLAELTVHSPIAGRVLTWDAEALLKSRPVSRGQVLLTVGDVAGPWVLELDVPDHHAGHVVEAQAEFGREPLPATFILATDPGRRFAGRVAHVSQTTEVRDEETPTARVAVALDEDELKLKRPGATVVANIHCGRRALGYVWLHDLIDAVRTWVLF